MSIKELSLKEASALTGYHPDYISYLIRNGKIKGSKIGRNWFVSKTELQGYLSTKQYSSITLLFKKKVLYILALVTIVVVFASLFFLSNPPPTQPSQNVPDESEPIVAQ